MAKLPVQRSSQLECAAAVQRAGPGLRYRLRRHGHREYAIQGGGRLRSRPGCDQALRSAHRRAMLRLHSGPRQTAGRGPQAGQDRRGVAHGQLLQSKSAQPHQQETGRAQRRAPVHPIRVDHRQNQPAHVLCRNGLQRSRAQRPAGLPRSREGPGRDVPARPEPSHADE